MKLGVDRRTMIGALVAAGALTSSALAQSTDTGLDGDWQGSLANITGPGIAPPPDGEFPAVRLRIDRRNVLVFLGGQEIKPGTFEIKREATNAVITSIQSDTASPIGESWVETWTFVVTLTDPNTLAVNYLRVVNNNMMRSSADGASFSQIRTGQFR